MFFQLYFLTDVAHLRPDLAGWAVGIGKVWDAVNDPLFGLASDRICTRWGRRRVFLLFGAVPVPEQSPQVIQVIRWFMGPVPAVLLILSILFAWFYPITREVHASLREQLAARRGE